MNYLSNPYQIHMKQCIKAPAYRTAQNYTVHKYLPCSQSTSGECYIVILLLSRYSTSFQVRSCNEKPQEAEQLYTRIHIEYCFPFHTVICRSRVSDSDRITLLNVLFFFVPLGSIRFTHAFCWFHCVNVQCFRS